MIVTEWDDRYYEHLYEANDGLHVVRERYTLSQLCGLLIGRLKTMAQSDRELLSYAKATRRELLAAETYEELLTIEEAISGTV